MLLSFKQDPVGLTASDLSTPATEVAAAMTSQHEQWLAGAQTGVQCSDSNSTALPGSLRQRFSLNSSARHASLPGHLQPSYLQADSRQTASSSPVLCSADAGHGDHIAAAQAEAGAKTHSRGHADDPCRVQPVSSASSSNTQHQDANRPVATSNGWHLRASSPVAGRKNNMYAEQQAYWHKKEALCPTIKNCIQEVQQLRAQLSADSADLNSEAPG